MLNEIKFRIDNSQFDSLWFQALDNPQSFWPKITLRQLGKRRLEKLQVFLTGMGNHQNAFYVMLARAIELELKQTVTGQITL